MKRLSDHFSYDDFSCHCGECPKEHRLHLGLVGGLEQLGGVFRKAVRIDMAYRCSKFNQKVSGHRKSYHMQGKAAHIHMDGIPLTEVFKACEKIPEFRGIGYCPGENYVHVDTRGEPAEWVKENGAYLELTPERKRSYGLASEPTATLS